MDKKNYNSLLEIKRDLETLNLHRQIQMEELKLTRHQFEQDLSIGNWIGTALQLVKKYGIALLIRKILK